LCALRIESPQAGLDLGEDPAAGPDGEQAQLLGLERLEALERRRLLGGPGRRWGRGEEARVHAGKGHRIAFL